MSTRLVTPERLRDIQIGIGTDIACESAWRSGKQDEFPNDKRNGEAVEILDRIEATIGDIPADLLLRYQAVWATEEHCVGEAWSQTLRGVGFYSEPVSAQALIEQFLADIEPEIAMRAA